MAASYIYHTILHKIATFCTFIKMFVNLLLEILKIAIAFRLSTALLQFFPLIPGRLFMQSDQAEEEFLRWKDIFVEKRKS